MKKEHESWDSEWARRQNIPVEFADGTIEFWEYGKRKFRQNIFDEFKPSMVTCE